MPIGQDTITVVGTAAAGSAPIDNPVQIAGTDGTFMRVLLTDASGRQLVVGAAAAGTPVTGNPVLVAGSDGTNVQTLHTDASGNLSVSAASPGSDRTQTGTLTAVAQTVAVSTQGSSTVALQMTGTFTATVVFEGTDDGATWVRLVAQQVSTSNPLLVLTANAVGLWQLNCAGFSQVRVRCTLYTSGTVNVTLEASIGSNAFPMSAGVNGGAAPPGIAVVGGVSGTNVHTLHTDASGNLFIAAADASNTNHALLTDTSGRLLVLPDPNSVTVHNNATITASGNSGVLAPAYGVKEVSVHINIANAPTGTLPTLYFDLVELDANLQVIQVSQHRFGAQFTTSGQQVITLPASRGPFFQLNWVIGGTTPSFTGVYVKVIAKNDGAASTPDPGVDVIMNGISLTQSTTVYTRPIGGKEVVFVLRFVNNGGSADSSIQALVYEYDPLNQANLWDNHSIAQTGVIQVGTTNNEFFLLCPSVTSSTLGLSLAIVGTTPNWTVSVVAMQKVPGGQWISSPLVGSISGRVQTMGRGETPVEATAYVEQTTNAIRSLVSTDARDSSGSTGAHFVTATYYTAPNGLPGPVDGPFTELVTMSGLTPVNMINASCFIESLEVSFVGTDGFNDGTIQMFSASGGGGSVMASIAPGDNRTRYAHHYVGTGRVCHLLGIAPGSSAPSGQGARFAIKSFDFSAGNQPEKLIAGDITAGGATGQALIPFSAVKRIFGPARIRAYATPSSILQQTASVDMQFFDL